MNSNIARVGGRLRRRVIVACGSGTFDVTFEEGHAYAALCFISDREGGLPHAIRPGMYDVFEVGGLDGS